MDPSDADVTVSEDGAGISRRDAIKKGAIVGGAVVWATPVIQAIGISPAGAQQPSPTVPGGSCPGCANCTASAAGLIVSGIVNLSLGVANGSGCTCTVDADVDLGNLADVKSQTVCGRADSTMCRASALVEGLDVEVLDNVFLRGGVISSCVNCGTGASQIANLRLVVTLNTGGLLGLIGGQNVDIDVPINVTPGCNSGLVLPTSLADSTLSGILSGLGINLSLLQLGSLSDTLDNILGSLSPLLALTANEQTCTNGTLTVNALHVVVAGQHVIVAQSKAGGPGCACAACSPNPTCTPPTVKLC